PDAPETLTFCAGTSCPGVSCAASPLVEATPAREKPAATSSTMRPAAVAATRFLTSTPPFRTCRENYGGRPRGRPPYVEAELAEWAVQAIRVRNLRSQSLVALLP